jgi:hypothetical protein
MTDIDAAIAHSPAPRQPTARVWAVLFLALAAALLALAAPRLVAAVVQVPGDAVYSALERNRPVSIGALDSLIDSRIAAGKWIDSGRVDNMIGIAAMQLLRQMSALPTRQRAEESRYLAMAITALQDGLSRQPAQPYAWFQLAYAYIWRGEAGDEALAERAWRMAVSTGPNELTLVIPRLAMGFLLWPNGDAGTRQMIHAEIRRAASNQPRALARLAIETGRESFVRVLLTDKPALLSVYNEMVRLPEAGSPLFP